jgi:hypothetical protein
MSKGLDTFPARSRDFISPHGGPAVFRQFPRPNKAQTRFLDDRKRPPRITTNRYRDKAALLKDVLEDEAAYREETRNFDKAVLDLWAARADMEKAMGED